MNNRYQNRLFAPHNLVGQMFMMREILQVWEVGCVVIAKQKLVIPALTVIPVAKMFQLAGIDDDRLINLKKLSARKTESEPQIDPIGRQDFLLKLFYIDLTQLFDGPFDISEVLFQKFMQHAVAALQYHVSETESADKRWPTR